MNKIKKLDSGRKVELPPNLRSFVKARGASMLSIARDASMPSMERLQKICGIHHDSICFLRFCLSTQDGRDFPILRLYSGLGGNFGAAIDVGNIEVYNLAALHLNISSTLANYEANIVRWNAALAQRMEKSD